MKTVALEELVASTILDFCENLAELGCPRESEPDMWYRELPSKDQIKVASKLIEIVERDIKRFEEEDKPKKKKGKK